jgi:hypothetical protein
MAPIQPSHKRYGVLERALAKGKINQSEFDFCVNNGMALSTFLQTFTGSKPEEVPLPSPALLAPKPEEVPKSPQYDVEAAQETPRAPAKRKRFTEPFHGGVALMSLQEKFDALADKVLQETEEGIRKDAVVAEIEDDVRRGWWGFSLLGR